MPEQESIVQRTIKDTARFVGMTIHRQRKAVVSVYPAEVGSGYYFVRKDINSHINVIPAHWYNIVPTGPGTTLSNEHGITVSHAEYILAALRGCGIDNARIEIDGPQLPFMDGSAKPFVDMFLRIGKILQSEPRHIYWVHGAVEFRHQDHYAVVSPDKESRFTIHLANYGPGIDTQVFSFKPTNEEFAQGIAPARLFATPHQLDEFTHLNGSKDALLRHILLLTPDADTQNQPLRFENEFIRHIVLKTFGILSLMRHAFIGHLYIKNPTVAFLHEFVHQFFSSRGNWSYLSYQEYRTIIQSEERYDRDINRFRHSDNSEQQ